MCSKKSKNESNSFSIHHFTEIVEYSGTGFLAKNQDTVISSQLDVLRTVKVL
jgi:myosin heavy subunit